MVCKLVLWGKQRYRGWYVYAEELWTDLGDSKTVKYLEMEDEMQRDFANRASSWALHCHCNNAAQPCYEHAKYVNVTFYQGTPPRQDGSAATWSFAANTALRCTATDCMFSYKRFMWSWYNKVSGFQLALNSATGTKAATIATVKGSAARAEARTMASAGGGSALQQGPSNTRVMNAIAAASAESNRLDPSQEITQSLGSTLTPDQPARTPKNSRVAAPKSKRQ